MPVNSSTFEVVVIVGMAVGVDYSLFYLRREREERAAGRSFAEALRIASRTSGRTILVSGLTVMATMSGLFLVGGGPFPGMALGTIAVVGIAVVGSLTVLPALLAWLGPKADAGPDPVPRPRPCRRPAVPAVGGARPPGGRQAADLGRHRGDRAARAGRPGARHAARRARRRRAQARAVVQTIDAIERAFPQAPAPAEVVVTGTDLTGPRSLAAVDALRARARAAGGAIREPVTATAIGGGRALVVGVTLAGNGADTASVHALATLRTSCCPPRSARCQASATR